MRKLRVTAADRVGEIASETVALSSPLGVVAEEDSASAPARNVDSDAQLAAVGDSGVHQIATHDGDGPAAPTAVLPAEAELASPATAGEVPPQRDTGAPLGAQGVLRGWIDTATSATIRGWAWNPKTPEKRIRLELVEGETQLATVVASIHRPDLVKAGIGDGQHAFIIELKPGLLAEGKHVLHLRCIDTSVAVPGSPIVVESSPDVGGPAFRCHIDRVTDKGVSGWIVPNEPMRHCVVTLKEAGHVYARGVASQFRTDLLAAGFGDGCYAFTLQMPLSLLDGNEHLLEIVEEDTGYLLNEQPIQWRSAAGTAGLVLTGVGGEIAEESARSAAGGPKAERPPLEPSADYGAIKPPGAPGKRPAASGEADSRTATDVGTRMLFDVSDLIYYISEHANLTGIQRVQSSIVLAMIDGQVLAPSSVIFLSFNAKTRNWVVIPTGFLISLLRDLFLPESQRLIFFPAEEARYGVLPGAQPFDGTRFLDDRNRSVLCLLGAAWVHQDYLHRVLALKRRFGTRFVMMLHDLIPIYARETCDQDTARVFEEFMRRALRHVDHILAVSENTAKDVRRYLATLQFPEPAITVTKNGSSFAEFLPKAAHAGAAIMLQDLPERFVLFVATIEGRKNHQLMFDLWRRMVEEGDDPPHLICVGRLGWKATAFVSALVETNYLDARVHLFREVSDTDLQILYARCLFTVCPSLYEGWGLPVGESLAMGKICVSSNRASIPEVAGDCGVYIDIDSVDQSLKVIRDLISDEKARKRLEAKIDREFVPTTWRSVAERVVAACKASVNIEWHEPYPYTALPYSTEVSFGRLDQDTDGTGELVLARIVDSRMGHFKYDLLDQQSFLLGEEIRSGGSWAQPERWGTWLCHSGGDIVFSLAAEASEFYYVFLRVLVCGVLHEQPVRLLANGEKLWVGKIGAKSKDVVLRVRKRANPTSPWKLRIGAEVDLSREIRSQIAALDSRVPTIGFERFIVIPENDINARLDVLSNLACRLDDASG
jgi:glycosyltransferase involved in cell wall biosynthesis